jgi:hypothetical protein
MRLPYGITVTVKRLATDRYGDVTVASTHTVDNCATAPRGSTENTDRRDTVVVGLSLYAPPDADIQPTDVITLPDGTDWQVDGQPGIWQTPFTGWTPGMELALKRVSG